MRQRNPWRLGLWLALLLAAIQFIQPDRTNPPATPGASLEDVANPGAEFVSIIRRACYDCHSNNTHWPWYSRFAPASWVIADDVHGGRAKLNFSEWNRLSPATAAEKLTAACDQAKTGLMPLREYRLFHPSARLSEKDISTLCSAAALENPGRPPR